MTISYPHLRLTKFTNRKYLKGNLRKIIEGIEISTENKYFCLRQCFGILPAWASPTKIKGLDISLDLLTIILFTMRKILQYTTMLLLTLCLFPACSEDDNNSSIHLTNGTTKEQIVFADASLKVGSINFTAEEPWKASIHPVENSTEEVDWLKLNSYSGNAGSYSLSLILQPNESGTDRSAYILLNCGTSQIRITITQTSVNEDGTRPDSPTYPGKKGNIKYIRMMEYDANGILSDIGELRFLYNRNEQVGMLVYKKQECEDNGKVDTEIDSIAITYAENLIQYHIQSKENGIPSADYAKGKIELGPKGYAHKGVCEKFDAEDNQLTRNSYELFYTTEAHLNQVKSTTNERSNEYRITWNNNNPTQVVWGSTSGPSFTDTATFTSYANQTDIDLNWLLMMQTEGWAFSSGDNYNIFSMLGYTGKRAQHLVETVHETDNTDFDRYSYTYEFNSANKPQKIIRKDLEGLTPEYVGCEIEIYYYK